MNKTTLYLSTAILTAIIIGLCLLAWLPNLAGTITIYDFFPILGLGAFSLMAMHYISGSLKRYLGLAEDEEILSKYFAITSFVVLVLILLHPGLLYFGLWSDGFGLPPVSAWEAYPDNAQRVALLMGSAGLTAFLLFELHRWFRQKSWWKYIEYASILGMALIFTHALIIGGELLPGWFRIFWIILGWILAMSIIYNYRYDAKLAERSSNGTYQRYESK